MSTTTKGTTPPDTGEIPTDNGIWARVGRLVTARPWWVLGGALLLLVPPLFALPSLVLTYDTLAELPDSAQSVQGYETLGEHFPASEISPLVLVIDADTPVTDPVAFQALGDLSRNLKRLDEVATVRSAAMPTNGETPELGDTGGVAQVGELTDQLQQAVDGATRLRDGAAQLRDGLAEMDARLPELADGLDRAGEGTDQLLGGVDRLRDGVHQLDGGLAELRTGLEEARDGAERLRTDVAMPAEEQIRAAWDTLFEQFTVGRTDPQYQDALEQVGEVYGHITGEDPRTGEQVDPGYEGLPEALGELATGLTDAVEGVGQLRDGAGRLDDGLAQLEDGIRQLDRGLAEAQPGVARLQDAVDRLYDGADRLTDGADELRRGLASGVARIRDADLDQLLPTGGDGTPFVITPGMLQALPEIRDQLDFFLAEDDTRTRLFVGLSTSPFSPDALGSVSRIEDIAELSLAQSPLEDAAVHPTGLTAFFDDIDTAADADFGLIVVAVILGVFLVLVFLLRALVAPLYMVVTVLLSFAAALGIATIWFQGVVGDAGLAWWIPPFLYVLLVALGADYNIYLMSRVREEAERKPTRVAVAEATRLTGGVITSAGLILAGTFAALMAADMGSLVQMGFATTVGILIDTFLVRTFLVPSIATLLGRYNWWPSARAQHD